MLIDLPPQIETLIEQQAHKQGISAEVFAKNLIVQQLAPYQRKERAFDYDIDEIQMAMDSGFIEMPKGTARDLDTFTQWIKASLA